jgi:hypothetical protein
MTAAWAAFDSSFPRWREFARGGILGAFHHPGLAMRLLVAIPHYFDPAGGRRHGSLGADAQARGHIVAACLANLRQQFGRPQCVIDMARRTTAPANHGLAAAVDVVVCTTRGKHLLDRLDLGPGYFTHHAVDVEPRLLGFECHAALRDRLADGYDFYCYLEDDLLIRDPWFFVKLNWFVGRFGEGNVLVPNRYEVARDRVVHKAYVDGPLRRQATAKFQRVADDPELAGEAFGVRARFERTTNPHAGGFFLTAAQMTAFAARPDFLDRDTSFIGPLESAATLGVMRAFRVYKPAADHASFLEVEHQGSAFLGRITPAKSDRT